MIGRVEIFMRRSASRERPINRGYYSLADLPLLAKELSLGYISGRGSLDQFFSRGTDYHHHLAAPLYPPRFQNSRYKNLSLSLSLSHTLIIPISLLSHVECAAACEFPRHQALTVAQRETGQSALPLSKNINRCMHGTVFLSVRRQRQKRRIQLPRRRVNTRPDKLRTFKFLANSAAAAAAATVVAVAVEAKAPENYLFSINYSRAGSDLQAQGWTYIQPPRGGSGRASASALYLHFLRGAPFSLLYRFSLSLSFLLRSLNHRGLPFSHVGLWAFNATASRARVPFDIFAVAREKRFVIAGYI